MKFKAIPNSAYHSIYRAGIHATRIIDEMG